MERNLNGIAVVTGAGQLPSFMMLESARADLKFLVGSGIGRDCAFAYAAAGVAGIVFADINIEGAQEAASESQSFATHSSYRAIALTVDVSQEDGMNSMIERAVQEFGRIDYAVNSAGVSFQVSNNPELHTFSWLEQSLTGPRLASKL